jgi:PAS domain S-box-containing protein
MTKLARILNLDDNLAARYLRTRSLVQEGFEVIEASTGAEALRIVREQRPEIALLDVKLPDMSGLEVCSLLKADPTTSDIPVVQISATHITEEDRAAGFQHGADIYLTEPTETIVLVTVIRTLLRLRQSESRLLVSEERFRAIVNQATAGIVQTDLTGRILHANERYCDFVGRPLEELQRLSLFDVTHPEDVEHCQTLFERLVRDGTPFETDKRYLRQDGLVVWTSNSISVVRDKNGIAQHAIAIVIDITERKRGEEREHFLASVSEGLAALTDQASTLQRVTAAVVPAIADWCAVDLVDSDGTHKRIASSHIDPLQEEMLHPLGAAPDEAGADVSVPAKVFATRQPELISSVWDARPGARRGDESRLRALREFGLRSYICVPLVSRDRVLGTLTLGTSKSGRRYRAGDLVMATEVGRRVSVAVENANLYYAIRQSAKRKDEFLATLAHELRNPLAPLRNSLQIMRTAGNDKDVVDYAHGVMERQVSQLRRLVDDLLDVSRIDTGKIDLRRERVLLSAVVKNALEAIRPAIESKHELVVVLPPEDIYLDVDPARLAQVITNLLDNADKYTPAGGHISLSATVHDHEATIVVADTGIGINGEMLDNIFDMFVQGDSSFERPYGGLGIGLTLVKRLVEMHGGSIRAESAGPGKGSTFIVTLPSASRGSELPPSTGARDDSADASPGVKRVILVVDDNRDSASSLGSLLELMGHRTHVVYDGPNALEAAKKYRPEIIFLDIGLPGISGYEVARRLREDEASRNARIVALSGYGTVEDRKRSMSVGFDAHVVKPIDIEEINKILRQAAH